VSDPNLAGLHDLAARFAAAAIPATEWTHLTHLTIGAWHVCALRSRRALDRLRAGIRRLTTPRTVRSTPIRGGYHETITRAYVRLLAAFLRARPVAKWWRRASRRCS